jgi:hypothetical protein
VDVEFFVELVHQHDVNENLHDENVDRTLLGEPEAQFEAAEPNRVQGFDKENAESVRDDEPYNQQTDEVAQVDFPVLLEFRFFHGNGEFVLVENYLQTEEHGMGMKSLKESRRIVSVFNLFCRATVTEMWKFLSGGTDGIHKALCQYFRPDGRRDETPGFILVKQVGVWQSLVIITIIK